jgi:cytochrome oxidase Cu insertion factor (SCO1/SenC/PrrC family)
VELATGACLCLIVLGACQEKSLSEPALGARVEEMPYFTDLGGDFALTDQHGKMFRLAEQRGRTALLFFGYTSCPDFCPTTLSRLVQVREVLGTGADSVLAIFVSIDPERDTPEVLRQYLGYFPIEVVGLTGRREDIDRAVSAYGAEYAFSRGEEAQVYVSHSTHVYLIDAQGRVRHLFDHNDEPQRMAATIRQLWDSEPEGPGRRRQDDALLAAAYLGRYSCGLWEDPDAYDYALYFFGGDQEGSERVQPAFPLGLTYRGGMRAAPRAEAP